MNKWIYGKVIKGKKIGTTLGYPTLNIQTESKLKISKGGVYSAFVKIQKNIYKGILFYGPRLVLNETKKIIEIFLFDFNSEIYGKDIFFKPVKFIRIPLNFNNLDDLKNQISKDIIIAKNHLLD